MCVCVCVNIVLYIKVCHLQGDVRDNEFVVDFHSK